MIAKEIIYSREFISKTTTKNIPYSENSVLQYHQSISEEDEKIRNEISKKFSLISHIDFKRDLGYDEKIIYIFKIGGFPNQKGDPLKNIKYDAKLKIKKSSSKDSLKNLSDLEKFLIKKGFKKLK